MKKRIILLLLPWLLMPGTAWPQGVTANAGNIHDPRILFVTPAAIGLQRAAHVVTGYELYYTGIADDRLRNGFAAFSFPARRWGNFGFSGQYFTSQIFRRGDFSFGYGRSLFSKKLGLGLNVGLINLSYNRENFRLVDPDDPVFRQRSSKNTLDVGASVLVNPIGPLFIGMAVSYLNQPNASLIDQNVRTPISADVGMMVDHPMLRPLLNVRYSDEKLDVDLGLESWFFERHAMLCGNYTRQNLSAGAAYVIDAPRYSFRFDYAYQYPLSDLSKISNGFHQFMLTYTFSTQPWDYRLEGFPPKRTIYAGENASYTLETRRKGGFDKSVTLAVSGSVPRVFSAILPDAVGPGATSTLTLSTDPHC